MSRALHRNPRITWIESSGFTRALENCQICPNIFFTIVKFNLVFPLKLLDDPQLLSDLESGYLWGHQHFIENSQLSTEFFLLRAIEDTLIEHKLAFDDQTIYQLVISTIKKWRLCSTCSKKCVIE